MQDKAEILLHPISRKQHFISRGIVIANRKLSLDDIEHGMIRNSKVWWAKGLLNKPFVGAFEKQLRINHLDPRIHFALNCGAESCPAVRFYCDQQVDEQLELATKVFIENETHFDKRSNTITISSLFDWYSGDFGGKKAVISFIQKYMEVPTSVKINYSAYSWKPLVGAFDS